MRILVAGWHGQVSLALSEAAARRDDITVYAVGRPALDLTDRPSIGRALFGIAPDVIINTAAYSDVDGAENDPATAFKRNQFGSAALAAQAARIGVPIIHLSTVYVFDGNKQAPYTEADHTAPINAYGRSKEAAEAAVASANAQHIILRTGWIYSPFGRNFITSILQRGKRQPRLTIDQTQHGSPTYAPHLANAILDIAAQISNRTRTEWGTYHIADQSFTTWHQFADHAFRLAEPDATARPELQPLLQQPNEHHATRHVPATSARRPLNARLDCTKLRDTFGIELPDWPTALADCIKRVEILAP